MNVNDTGRVNWQAIGYADGMAKCTKAAKAQQYPTRDKYSYQDEQDYLNGYSTAINDFQTIGYHPIRGYKEESNGT